MSEWPSFVPADLRQALEEVEGMRCRTGAQDHWVAIREWLERYEVEPPEFALPSDGERGGQ